VVLMCLMGNEDEHFSHVLICHLYSHACLMMGNFVRGESLDYFTVVGTSECTYSSPDGISYCTPTRTPVQHVPASNTQTV
jgi:hypothetical protein